MAGPRFDEVPIEIGGKRYRYFLGTYGLKALERSVGQPWPKIIEGAINDGWGFSVALSLFHAGLIFHHETMTERQASLLLDELGIDRFAEVFGEAMKGIAPEEGRDRPQEPTAAGNGIGMPSSQAG